MTPPPSKRGRFLLMHWFGATYLVFSRPTPLKESSIMDNGYLLKMAGISKTFPGVRALDNVDFAVRPGEVVALVGENGAGKSTLVKILSGVQPYDPGGVMLWDGQPFQPDTPVQAQAKGISIIHQEFNLCLNLSVAANIFLGRELRLGGRYGIMPMRQIEHRTRELLKLVQADIAPGTITRDLTVAYQQMVEIAKALSFDARLIVMDEPTSALANDEVILLFNIIRDLKAHNRSVIFISHRLEEIFEIADRVVVLRDGRLVGEWPIAEATPEQVIEMMVGHTLPDLFPAEPAQTGNIVLDVRGLCGGPKVRNVSFHLRAGEVLGLAGLVGAGRTETARLIFGIDQKAAGEIRLYGQPIDIANPRDALRAHIGLVPEDRQQEGLVLNLSVRENATLPVLDRLATRLINTIDRARQADITHEYIRKLDVHSAGLEQPVTNLSGGNQQKIVLAKWLATQPRVLILDEPTRGIDVGAKAEIHRLMKQLAQQGLAILMISSEMPEILGMSDRIVVMCDGRVTGELSRAEATQERVMALATARP
jgi:ribose transport system ATP-binding protein